MRDSSIVAAVVVAVLILSGCAEPPSIPPGTHIIGVDAQFGDVDSNQTRQIGCVTISATGGLNHGPDEPWQIGQCFDMHGEDNKFLMSPGKCLVRDDENPVRFHVKACRDAAPGSCETDLGSGNVVEYVSPCSGND